MDSAHFYYPSILIKWNGSFREAVFTFRWVDSTEMSSTKVAIVISRFVNKSAVHIWYKSGEGQRTLPWRTSDLIGCRLDTVVLYFTSNLRSIKYD